MKRMEILEALKGDDLLLTMIAEEIGERAVKEDPGSDATWETIGRASIEDLLDTPMGRGEV